MFDVSWGLAASPTHRIEALAEERLKRRLMHRAVDVVALVDVAVEGASRATTVDEGAD